MSYVGTMFLHWVAILTTTTNVFAYDKRIFDVTTLPVQSLIIKAGDNHSLACPGVTEHSLVLALEWLSYSGQLKLVEFMSDSTTVWANQDRISLLPDTFALAFHPATAEDSGEYMCLVNSRPKPDALVRLIVRDVPDPPGRPLIMSFTSRSVNLSWAPSQDTHHSAVTHYIIHTRVGEDGEWNAIDGILTPGNSTSYQVTSLHPYTVYSFRVVAVNALGASQASKESYYMVTLREAPTGKPIITTAHNTSATAIHISWRPPHHDTIHGEFLGYRISYRPRDKGADAVKEIYIRDPAVESHTIQNLETYTQYLVSLQVFNPEGPGPSTTVRVMTDEGVPSKPLNVSVTDIGSDQIHLKWAEPERTNGAILGYRVYFMYANYTDVQSLQLSSSGGADTANKNYIRYNLTNLRPYTEYKIWVKAYTDKHEGEPSEPVYNRTDISGPNAPRILNLTCQSQETVFIQWERPTQFLHSIDFYYIYIGGSANGNGDLMYNNITLPAETKAIETSFAIHNVTTNAQYEVRLGASTRSLQTGRVVHGLLSPAQFVHLRPGCDQVRHRNLRRGAGGDLSAGMIAGAVCAAFAFCLAICAFVLWRKCFHAAYYYLDDPPCSVPTAYLDWNAAGPPVQSADAAANATNVACTGGGPGAGSSARADCCYKGAIPVSQFARHVAELHADGDIGFSKEYEAIQMDGGSSASTVGVIGTEGGGGGGGGGIVPAYNSQHSQHPDNRAKNRYLNIIAYDHSRVQLLQMPGQKKQIDYINANYIDGFQWLKAYIGTQGPLPSTFDCFWRMVWEQRVHIIVMITNLVERGRRKCDMYWPKEGTETYGVIQVKLVKEDVMATYTVRTLLIRHLKIKKKKQAMAEKYVYQYHYTSWPDHGTPDHPLPVLHFVKKSAAANSSDAGPIVVHCSAGVGRTGTYIVLDAMLRQIRARNEVNVFGFLRHIRTQRNFLVQTEEQYIFIHDALVEAIESGETNVTSGQFVKYMQLLLEAIQAAGNAHGQANNVYVNCTVGVSACSLKEIHSNRNSVSAAPASAASMVVDNNILLTSQDKSTTATTASSTAAVMYLAFEYQFKLATSFQCRDFNLVSAHKSVNVLKNRLSRLVPVESSRVHLTPKPGEDGSDYINATWLPGFGSLREFIVTQHPLPHTINDFWQMVWDHNAQTLVVLSQIDNQDFDTFWPATTDASATIDSDTYRVRLTHAHHQLTHSTLDFAMRSMQDDYELNVRMVQCADWPRRHCGETGGMLSNGGGGTTTDGSLDMMEMLALPALVQAAQAAGYQNGPVVVVDRYGGAEAAIFCALATLRKHLHYDNHLDVYMYSKLYHNKRPGIWSSGVEDYLRLHRALYALCTAPASTIGAIGSVLAPIPAAAQTHHQTAQVQQISQQQSQPAQQQAVPDLYANANGTPALMGSGGGDAGAGADSAQGGAGAQAQVVNGSVSNDSVRVPPEEAPLIPDVMKIHNA